MAADIDDVRKALGLAEITLYGDSYGSFLAQSYAYRHGGR
jgi:pimeloyl-ACP methyl ester carboxylesterase